MRKKLSLFLAITGVLFLASFFIYNNHANSGVDTCAEKGLSDNYQSDVKSAANEYIASHPEIANQSSGSNLAAVAQLRDGTTAILIGRGFMGRRILDPSGNPYPQMIGVWKSSDTDVTVYRVTAGGKIISQAIQAGYCGGHETFEGVDIGRGSIGGGGPGGDGSRRGIGGSGGSGGIGGGGGGIGGGGSGDGLGSLPTTSEEDFGKLIESIFGWAMTLVGIAVFVNFLWAGILWFTAAGRPGPIGQAKEKMTNSLIGAIILLASYLILNTINPDLVKNTLNLPGLGTDKGINLNPGLPIPAPSLLSDLQAERAKYGTSLSHADAGKLLNAVAWKNRDAGWGLLKKTTGNICPLSGSGQPISCDWLVHKPSGLGLDVFNGGPGMVNELPTKGDTTPQWGNGQSFDQTLWIAPVQP